MIAFTLITDGRVQYVLPVMESVQAKLKANFDALFIINDSGDPTYQEFLEVNYPSFQCVHHDERRGLAGAVRSAWETAYNAGADYLWHQEDDFTITRKVKVDRLAQILHCEPHLASLTLKRQPWNDVEVAAGDIIASNAEDHTDRECPSGHWVEHQRLFSFNPSLVPRRTIELVLRECTDTLERGVTDALLANGQSFAYFGKRDDEPRCNHVGHVRSNGYRW